MWKKDQASHNLLSCHVFRSNSSRQNRAMFAELVLCVKAFLVMLSTVRYLIPGDYLQQNARCTAVLCIVRTESSVSAAAWRALCLSCGEVVLGSRVQ